MDYIIKEWDPYNEYDRPRPKDFWLHPLRYPKHKDPTKGQVYGGECNTTRCINMDATWWNKGTYALYCRGCGSGHNYQQNKPNISDPVDKKPNKEQADKINQEFVKLMERVGW